MTNMKTLLRGTTIAAALAVALPLLHSESARALPNSGCYTDPFTGCGYCHVTYPGEICFYSSCDGNTQYTCSQT